MIGYYEGHGKNLVSAADVKISSRLWGEFFGDIPAIEACDVDRIEAFKIWLAEKDYSAGYINRIISVGRAALMRAYARRLIAVRPIVKGVPGHRGEPKGQPMSVAQLTQLYSALQHDHSKRFFVLGLGTGGPPDALMTLEWPQVDLAGGCIRLNPPGRRQTKKRRAEVPICKALAERLLQWGTQDGWEGPVVHFRGKRVKSIKTGWRNARASIGLGEACNPYSLRHSVGKWLRSESVPPWEVAGLMGHKLPGYTITEIYAGADPQHMAAAKATLDKLLRAVCVPLVTENQPLRAVCVPPVSGKLERAKGFEPSTLTLAT